MSLGTIKLVLAAFLLLLASGASAFFVLNEQRQTGQAIRDGLLNLRAFEAIKNDEAAERLDPGPDLDKLHGLVLASESDTVGFLAFIDDLASQIGVSISATELQIKKTSEDGFENLSASFSISGDDEAVEGVIELFELLPYRSQVESLSLMRQEGREEANLTVLVSVRE